MFDSLKKSFSKFRKGVEEEVEVDDRELHPETESKNQSEESASTTSDDAGLMKKAKLLSKGKVVIDESVLKGPLAELELALLQENISIDVVDAILNGVRTDLIGETRRVGENVAPTVEHALATSLKEVLSKNQFDLIEYIECSKKPVTLVFAGINGVGKTTTIAKLSQHLESRGYSTVMANGDTYRAGAEEQITHHASSLGTKLISHGQGGDPTAVLYDAVEYARANDVDVVLGDTAGRLHTDNGLMDQLDKIRRVVNPDLTLFVDEAVAGQDAVNRVKGFDEAASVDGVILTKAEAPRAGGAAISMAHTTGRPVIYLGTGQSYDHIEPFDPDKFVDELIKPEIE